MTASSHDWPAMSAILNAFRAEQVHGNEFNSARGFVSGGVGEGEMKRVSNAVSGSPVNGAGERVS